MPHEPLYGAVPRACSVPQFPRGGVGVPGADPPPSPQFSAACTCPTTRTSPSAAASRPRCRTSWPRSPRSCSTRRSRAPAGMPSSSSPWPRPEVPGGLGGLRAGLGGPAGADPTLSVPLGRESGAAAQRGVRVHHPGHQQPPLRLHQGHFRLPGEPRGGDTPAGTPPHHLHRDHSSHRTGGDPPSTP